MNLIWTALRHFKLGSYWMQFQCWPLSTTSKPASLSKISPMAQLLLGKAAGSEEALTGFIKMNLTNGMVATRTSEVHFFKVFLRNESKLNLKWTTHDWRNHLLPLLSNLYFFLFLLNIFSYLLWSERGSLIVTFNGWKVVEFIGCCWSLLPCSHLILLPSFRRRLISWQ